VARAPGAVLGLELDVGLQLQYVVGEARLAQRGVELVQVRDAPREVPAIAHGEQAEVQRARAEAVVRVGADDLFVQRVGPLGLLQALVVDARGVVDGATRAARHRPAGADVQQQRGRFLIALLVDQHAAAAVLGLVAVDAPLGVLGRQRVGLLGLVEAPVVPVALGDGERIEVLFPTLLRERPGAACESEAAQGHQDSDRTTHGPGDTTNGGAPGSLRSRGEQ
jgi:hypothetical protein